MIRSERAETLGADLLWKFFMPALKLIHTATTDTSKLSCLCQLRRCELDFRQLKTIADILKSEHIQSNHSVHTVTPDTTQTRPSCRVWCGGVNWVGPTSAFSVGVCRAAQALSVRPLDALRRRTGRLNPHRLTWHTALSCRVWRAVWIGHWKQFHCYCGCVKKRLQGNNDLSPQ